MECKKYGQKRGENVTILENSSKCRSYSLFIKHKVYRKTYLSNLKSSKTCRCDSLDLIGRSNLRLMSNLICGLKDHDICVKNYYYPNAISSDSHVFSRLILL